MTDSNLDWGQAIREINTWLARQPAGTRVTVLSRIGKAGYVGPWYLDHRVRFLERGQPVPEHGLLVISPVWVCGVYDDPGENAYEFLQRREPVDVIGRSMPVYDLDSPATPTTPTTQTTPP